MKIARPLMTRIILWCLAYLWTASAALAISNFAGWQYDGDAGWWLVTAYSFPALTLASPLLWVAGNPELGATYCLVALAALTMAAAGVIRRPAKQPTGS
ncbi:hypothetical protein C8J44_2179 [Sphingomonas sp. PP-CE-3A-406]|nr:hypothetical protein C8J44_2179 [Sphingomonas sp. PP-CE-3A-406]